MTKQYYYIQCLFILIVFFFLVGFFNKTCHAASASKDFNIVLITIDALRADHLSCYGYERKTSPNIDKIAEKGILFKNAIAPSSWTAPSMASLLTSVYPSNHGVIHGVGYKKNKDKQEIFSDELTTLTEILKSHGYTTFGVASNLHLSEKLGFARGFDQFKCLSFLPAPSVNQTIYSWENDIKNSDKFFLWVHYIDPHHFYHSRQPWIDEYTSPALTQKLNIPKKNFNELKKLIPTFEKDPKAFSNLIALYDSEINYADHYIGKLIQKFELDKNTLIIITADHGEGFLDHAYQLGHGHTLYREGIHIPLIIKLPSTAKKGTVEEYVNLLDIMPTILHTLNITFPEYILGKSILKKKGPFSWLKKLLLRKDTSRYNFAEVEKPILKAIMTPEWKYIYNYKNKTEQLYNIKSDHLELNNLVDKNIKQRNQLREKLFDWVSDSKKYPTKRQTIQLSPKEKEKLKALGYIK